MVCFKLHNFIMDQNSDLEVPNPSHADDHSHVGPPERVVHFQEEYDMVEQDHRRRRDLDTSRVREDFTTNIRNLALKRPKIRSVYRTTYLHQKNRPRQDYSCIYQLAALFFEVFVNVDICKAHLPRPPDYFLNLPTPHIIPKLLLEVKQVPECCNRLCSEGF